MKLKVQDFSNTPGARYRTDGNSSGEEFYESMLRDSYRTALEKREKLIVNLDGTEGYATSFLDEAFGRLAEEFGVEEVLKTLEIISTEEPDWVEEIRSYILERREAK